MSSDGPSPAALVRDLRVRYGSHDKLAAALGTSRQRVIAWEHGAAPSARYADKLAALSGREPGDYRTGSAGSARDVEQRLAQLVQTATLIADRLEAQIAAAEARPDGQRPPQPAR